MLKGKRLAAKVAGLATLPCTATAFRLIHAKYVDTALASIGSYRFGGRYNPASAFEVLYLADSPLTALQEVELLIRRDERLFAVKGSPRILLSVDVSLRRMLDLTDGRWQKALNTNLQELTGSWLAMNAAGHIAPTQTLGQVCYENGRIEALKVPSARDAQAFNLAVFPDRLAETSWLRVFDREGFIDAQLSGGA